MPEIAKTYEPASVEAKWYEFWLQNECFKADPARVSEKRPAYSIVIPPPNVTGVLTLGHVLNNTIQDILARRARMLGKEVLWLPGTDHAGIATQNVVEKALRKAGEIKHRDDLGREAMVAKIWEWKEKYGGIILQQLRALGASCDWSRTRFTMDEEYSRCVSRVFVDLYKKGQIYRGKRMVNWCPASLTALSDEEVVMKEQNGVLYYFRVEVVEEPGRFLTIATTRPETIPGDTAIAVNPKDSRYAHLIGQHVRRPLPRENQVLIPIIGDDAVVFDFGTGVLKVTPAHDRTDFDIWARIRRYGISQQIEELQSMQPIDIMHPNGVMNDLAGADLAGLERFAARQRAVELLAEAGVLEKEEPYRNNVGFSERADVPIEPRLSEQWFLKYPSVAPAQASVNEPTILEKRVSFVHVRGSEITGIGIRQLRKAALLEARRTGIIGGSFRNEDSGFVLQIGRQSLTHAFTRRGDVNIKAVAVLPELIRTAIHLSSEPHHPPNPLFKAVHRFLAALVLGNESYRVYITAKELVDGTILYDHKAKKVATGGKSLEAHPREGKLDTQPAPVTSLTVRDLLGGVNGGTNRLHFHPRRWAKVYEHWMGNLQDWCISRQLWWGHRVPVWRKNFFPNPLFGPLRAEQTWNLPFGPEELKPTSDMQDSGCIDCSLSGLDGHSTVFRSFMLLGKESDVLAATTSLQESRELARLGFEQDPDVLDTWFSSWLWPFATMGWPDKTATLAKFYPTSDLVTAPDILFFWVARMIMAGFEYMGELPFRNVYFTSLIRDKQGRKLSKSLGNSPDPLDLIAQYGADALRFGTMRSAPFGQDVTYDEKTVELGRNFCTKLWNAARFRQMQGGAMEGEIDPVLLTSDDKWILLRLDAAIREVSAALDEYRFSDAANALYRFFWSEYCDWYLEASKAVLNGENAARQANSLAVTDFVLGHALRLFHPFLPFITEELWHGLGFHDDLPEDQGGRTIMFARWPVPFDDDFKTHYGLDVSDEAFANAKYETVNLGRGLRRDFNIASSKRVRFVLQPTGSLPAQEAEVLQILLNAEPLEVLAAFAPAKGTPTALTPLGSLYLPLEGLIDVAAERERLTKEISKVDTELTKVRAKLADENFAAKVPAKVLDEHRQREAAWAEKRSQLAGMLDSLGGQ